MSLMDEVNVLVDQYVNFFREKIDLREVGKHVAITTPFLDRHNDSHVIYVTKISDDRFIITDDGEVLIDLEQSGCKFNTPSKMQVLDTILKSNGVKLLDGELVVETSRRDFAARKSNIIAAMMELDNMHVLAATRTRSFFFDDVREWLNSRKINYAVDMKLQGSSGYLFNIDFLIGRGSDPEMALQTLTSPDVDSLARVFLMKNDLSYRKTDVRVMINDEDLSEKMERDIRALSTQHNISMYKWSSHEKIDLLA